MTEIGLIRDAIRLSNFAVKKYLQETNLYHANSLANIAKYKSSIKKVQVTKLHTVNPTSRLIDNKNDLKQRPVNWENDKKAKA